MQSRRGSLRSGALLCAFLAPFPAGIWILGPSCSLDPPSYPRPKALFPARRRPAVLGRFRIASQLRGPLLPRWCNEATRKRLLCSCPAAAVRR